MRDMPKPKHDHKALIFPEGFLWGAGTSSYQVEGNNINSDWEDFKSAGEADNQYNLYEEDFNLAKKLGHNAHRLSIEWSRIEPEEGKFDQNEINHYVKALKYLKSLNLQVMLTLWHFSSPNWFAKKGGWSNLKSPYYFERFVKKIIPELKDYVDLWITLNEPGIHIYKGYLMAVWPPKNKSKIAMLMAYQNLARAHKKAYKVIHKEVSGAKVGIANNLSSFDSFHHHNIREGVAVWFLDLINNHLFYKLTGKTHDFLGINYYVHQYISFNGNSHLPSLVDIATTKKDVSDMGWEIYPEGIFDVLLDMSDYHLPIYITENGLASTNDDRRVRFLLNYLKEIYHAIHSGVEVKGYFHWSLIDNFEWGSFEDRFGLIEVDYTTQKRTPKPSAHVYEKIIKENGIPHDLLKLLGHGMKVKDVIKKQIKE